MERKINNKEVKMSKKNSKEYDSLMKQKHDLEDRMANIFNAKWKLSNENTKLGLQLRVVEDQLRSLFGRVRIELKKDKEKATDN